MSRRGKGVTAASVAVFALVVVMLASLTTYLALSITVSVKAGARQSMEVVERSKHEVKATLSPGLPPGVSPKAWLIIHEEHGVGDHVRDMVVETPSGVFHVVLDRPLQPGQCMALRLERIGLPKHVLEYSNTTIAVHADSGAVGQAYRRQLNPDTVYPCTLDPPVRPGNMTVRIEVVLRQQNGAENICGIGRCLTAVSPAPGALVVTPHRIVVLSAESNITVSGTTYFFGYWLIKFTHPPSHGLNVTANPLRLWVDDDYDVSAVFVRR